MKFHALCVMMTALTWGVKAMSSNTRGVRGNLTDPSEGQSKHDCARRPPAEFGSILAQKANLTVSKANEGTLTISGPSVAKIRILTDRPVRLSRSVDTAIFILQFKRTFATGAPNAVLSGVTEGGELREVTIVLETAEYFALPTIPPFVTFAWKSDDEEIDQNLELQSATLFIDSFFERTDCIRKHAREYAEYRVCDHLVDHFGPKVAAAKDGGKVACHSLITDAACAVVDIEDGEFLTPVCIEAARQVCDKLVETLTEAAAQKIFNQKTMTVDQFCENKGYGDPCPSDDSDDHRHHWW